MSKRALWFGVQAGITGVLLAVLFRSFDMSEFGALFMRMPFSFYVMSLAVVLVGQIAYAWRWRVILAAAGVQTSFAVVIQQYFIGITVNNFLPSTVGGDVAKVYRLGRGRGYHAVTASVVLDRVLGVGLLALFAALTLWASPMPAPVLVTARAAVTGIASLALVVLAILAVGTGGLPSRVSWMGAHAVSLAHRLQRLRTHMAVALGSPIVIAQAAVVVLGYGLAVTWLYVEFISAQGGLVPSFATMYGIVMATTVLSSIPVSLNGLGLREQLHVALLAPIGVTREVAGAISLLLFAHLLVASLIGVVFWLRTPSVSPDPTAPFRQ